MDISVVAVLEPVVDDITVSLDDEEDEEDEEEAEEEALLITDEEDNVVTAASGPVVDDTVTDVVFSVVPFFGGMMISRLKDYERRKGRGKFLRCRIQFAPLPSW